MSKHLSSIVIGFAIGIMAFYLFDHFVLKSKHHEIYMGIWDIGYTQGQMNADDDHTTYLKDSLDRAGYFKKYF